MQKYRNNSDSRRVWTHIQRADGSTLELDPGETAELELPDNFEDIHLQPVLTKAEQKEAAKAAKEDKEAAEKAAKDAADKEAADAAAAAADQGVQS